MKVTLEALCVVSCLEFFGFPAHVLKNSLIPRPSHPSIVTCNIYYAKGNIVEIPVLTKWSSGSDLWQGV